MVPALAKPPARLQQVVVFDETQCRPASFELAAGGRVSVKVASGPQQSFTFRRADALGGDDEEEHTPLYPAGETSQPWCARRPISEATYNYMLARSAWAVSTSHPEARTTKAIDWKTNKIPF